LEGRAERVELVDGEGRVRVVIGDVSTDPERYEPGLVLLDEDGERRVEVLVEPEDGPRLALLLGGNALVEVGVDDPEPEVDAPGVFVVFSDRRGAPVLDLRVTPAGAVAVRLPR
jgi:hypothetical protein